MIAIRQVQDIHDGKVTITVPENFPATRAEIIILPVEDTQPSTQHLQHTLLNAPTLTEAELQPFLDMRDS
jgi:hypothetical protein